MRLPIPGTKGYEIDDSAVVYKPDGSVANTYRNGDGYVTTLIVTADGDFTTTGVHRLVGMAFKPEDRTADKFHVNHLDGDKENNLPSNVDWDTPANNNLHGALIRQPGRPRSLVLIGKDPVYFANLQEAASFIGCSIADAWFMVRDNIVRDGLSLVVNVGLGSEFHQVKIKTRDVFGRQPLRFLKMKHLETGEVISSHAAELARMFKVPTNHITTTTVEGESIRLFKDNWIIVDVNSEFPEITSEELEQLRERGKPKEVWCFNKAEQRLEIFSSAAAFIRVHQLSKKSITVKLKKFGQGVVDGLVYCYRGVKTLDELKEL